ncbi:phage portal protein [Neorhizobium sp. LMR1-1-1.1]
MGLFERWRGTPIKLTDGEFWRGFFGLGTTSGEKVTIESALSLDAVWACVNLVQNAAGTLPCIVYGGDGVTIDKNSPLYEILHDMPNIDDTAPEFWSMAALCLMMDGNFFAEKKMNGDRLVALNPLHPLSVEVCRDGRNTRYYEVTEDGKKRRIPEGKMFHVRGARLPGCDRGMSPIGVVRNTVGNALSGEKVAGRMFKNGLLSSLIVSSDQVLKPEQRKQIADTLTQFAGAEKAGGVTVLEAGFKPYPMSINPKDAQFLEARQYSVEQICRIFGVPPVMIGHAANGTTTWGSGIEQLILQFTKTCMRPMLKRIEAAIYRDLLDATTRKTVKVKFNMEELLRGDSQARAEFLSKMVQAGIYHVDEARGYEDKAPTPGGNRSIVNGTMTPLDKLGEEPVAQPTTPAARAA